MPVPNSTAEGAAAAAGEMGPAPPAPPPPPPLPDPWRPLADRAAAAAPEAGVSAREDAYLAAAVLAVEREAPAQVRKKGRRRREGGGGESLSRQRFIIPHRRAHPLSSSLSSLQFDDVVRSVRSLAAMGFPRAHAAGALAASAGGTGRGGEPAESAVGTGVGRAG